MEYELWQMHAMLALPFHYDVSLESVCGMTNDLPPKGAVSFPFFFFAPATLASSISDSCPNTTPRFSIYRARVGCRRNKVV